MPALESLLTAVIDAQRALDGPRPTPRQVTETAALLGWYPADEDRHFRPAVSA